MSGLRFCMVTTFYPPFNFGGDGMGVLRFSRALARRGHQVTVLQDIDAHRLLNRGPDPRLPPESDGVEVVRLRSNVGPLSVLLTHQLGRPTVQRRALRRFFEENSFDVINFHNISLVGGPGVLSHGRGIKLYMAHEHWLVCPTHVLWRHRRELCTGRQCLRCSLRYARPPQPWRRSGLLEREQRHVDAFIAMSEFSRDKHREFGFSREMEVVNYFLPEIAGPGTTGEESPHERPYFLFVGRLERIKGLDETIPALRDHAGADLLIAGDGEHGQTLRGIARGLDNVRFLGRLAPEELDRYYRHALALIVPSVCFETFGIVLIEAFRHGTPVIARRIGPFPEIVERCEGGLLFETHEELLGAMRRLQSEPGLRDRLAGNAREGFVNYWSESAVIPRYLDVVRRAAQTRGRRDILERLGDEASA